MILCNQYRWQNGNASAILFVSNQRVKYSYENILGYAGYSIMQKDGTYDYTGEQIIAVNICSWRIKYISKDIPSLCNIIAENTIKQVLDIKKAPKGFNHLRTT